MEDKINEVQAEETDLVKAPETEVVTSGDDMGMPAFNSEEEMIAFLAQVERRNRAIDTITRASLKKLAPTDFHDFGGKPLLQGVGAQRLLKYLGISVSDIERIPPKGYDIIGEDTAQRLRVTFRAKFKLGSMIIEGEGIRDTHNKFLCKTTEGYKEIADIELPDLDRGARTAMYRDGVSTLLGFKGLTWDYLKELGFTQNQTTGHTYKTGTKGGSAAGSDLDTKNKQTEIANMIFEMAEHDPNKAERDLIEYSKYTYKGKEVPGVKSASQLSPGRTNVVYNKVKRDYDELVKAYSPDTPDEQQEKLGF